MRKMNRNRLRILPFLFAAIVFSANALRAEPQTEAIEAQTEDQDKEQDPDFASQFIGTSYAGNLAVDGWTDFGGGLVSPPIYINQYQHEDGRVLVLTAKETAPAAKDAPANYEVTDALLVTKPRKGLTFSVACTKGEDYTLRYLGEARGSENAEWWTRIGRAWEIELETGKISPTKSRGVRCTNPSW